MMVDVGLLKVILEYVNSFEPKPVVDAVIDFVDQMCRGGNSFVLGKIFEYLSRQKDCFAFFKMFEQKIALWSAHMIAKAQHGD